MSGKEISFLCANQSNALMFYNNAELRSMRCLILKGPFILIGVHFKNRQEIGDSAI